MAIPWLIGVAAFLTALYLLKFLSPLATLLYQFFKGMEEGGKNVARMVYIGMRYCAGKTRDTLQGRKMSARLMGLVLGVVIISGDAGLLLLRVPALFRIQSAVPLPVSLEALAGVLLTAVGLFLGRLFLECASKFISPDAQFFPNLSKGWRIATAIIVGAGLLNYVIVVAYIAYYSQLDLDHLSTGNLDLEIVFYLSFPVAVATIYVAVGLEVGLSALPPLAFALATVLCALAGFPFSLIAWLFGVPRLVIAHINRGVVYPPSPLPDPTPVTITPLPPGTPEVELMPTDQYVIVVDFGHAYTALMEATARAAPKIIFAFGVIDKDKPLPQPSPVKGIKDVSPNSKQWDEAIHARLHGVALVSRLIERMILNLRQERAIYRGPSLVMMSYGDLEELIGLAGPLSKMKKDVPELKQIVVTNPSTLYQTTRPFSTIHHEAETLQVQGNIDLLILYSLTSPYMAAHGDEAQQQAIARFLAGLSIADQYAHTKVTLPRLVEQLHRLPVWALSAASAPVAVGKHRSLLREIARFFKKSLPPLGSGDVADTINQTSTLCEYVVKDQSTHTLDVPTDENAPLLFVVLLPFKEKEPEFEETRAYLQQILTPRYQNHVAVFLPAHGSGKGAKYREGITTVYCLFPVLLTGQLPGNPGPAAAIGP